MKIAVSGTIHSGKTTYINDFIKNWPNYRSKSLNKKITDKKQKKDIINITATEDDVEKLMNREIDQIINLPKKTNILLDRCVWDVLVYTIWLNARKAVSDDFVKKMIKITKETLVFYDIICFMPLTKQTPITFTDDTENKEKEQQRNELDVIYKELNQRYLSHSEVFYPFDNDLGCPAILEIYGDRLQRIELTKLYVNKNGKCYGDEESLIVPQTFDADLEMLKADHLTKPKKN